MDVHIEQQYIGELVRQADFAIFSVKQAEYALANAPQPLFFRELHAFLSHGAAISRLLWPPRDRDAKVRARADARGEHLRSVLNVDDTHVLHNRALRNHLEHFDVRLDTWAQETTHGAMIDMNIGPVALFVGGPGVGPGDFVRNYDPSTKVFSFRGDEFNVQELVDGVERVRAVAMQRAQTLVEREAQALAAAPAAE
jgi:hypothetical protein